MTGIEQSKKVVDVVADVGGALEKIAADKGSVFAKLSHLMPLSGDMITLAGTDFAALKQELADLDDAEKAQLLAEFKAKFQLDDAALEGKIEAGLDLAIQAEELAAKIVAFSKSLKAAPAAVEA
jgi:hypothetical protein